MNAGKILFLAAILGICMPLKAQAEVPDVGAWNCPEEKMVHIEILAVEICLRDGVANKDNYFKVAGEVVGIHEHVIANGKEKYYTALKNNDGKWIEITLDKDSSAVELLHAADGAVMIMRDNNGTLLSIRNIYFGFRRL